MLLPLCAAALWARPSAAEPTEPGALVNPLVPSPDCQNCHSFPNAEGHEAQPPYAPFFGWQGSLMANAARDPVFWAAVAIADQDEPGGTEDCVRCHAPRAFLEGRGGAISIDALQPEDFEGVGCELCHRMTDQGLMGNAQYAVDDLLGDGGVVARRGAWDYEPGSPQAPQHAWLFDEFTSSSQQCGTCHDVTTPRERLDDAGQPMGIPFNEQRTYSEWLGSRFAQPGDDFATCQDCHMPAVQDVAGCEDNNNQFTHPQGRRHDLVGANRFMLELLQAEYGDEGTQEVPDVFFSMTMDRLDELIPTAATLQVQGPAEVDLAQGLSDLVATVTNNTGHKLPTGYSEGRIMWLEVVARYGDEVVWSSGQWTPGEGPQDDEQLRSYQGVAQEYATGTTMHLLLNDHWVEDTRIPPAGLTPNIETDPVGDRYALLEDGTWPNFDEASYAFAGRNDVLDVTPGDDTDDVLDVQVRLLYLINTPEYVQLLADDNVTNDAGNHVAMLFDTAGGAPPTVLAEQSLSLPIVGFGEPPAGTTAADETGELPGTTTADETDTTATAGSSTDPGQDDDGGGGCSCASGPRGDRGAAWWLLLPLGLVARRRRRH
ncbi:MAG: MYXO-CTERM sorting domain-containing protein [Nannocystaceae bacterium]